MFRMKVWVIRSVAPAPVLGLGSLIGSRVKIRKHSTRLKLGFSISLLERGQTQHRLGLGLGLELELEC